MIPWKKLLRQLYVFDGERWLKNPNLFPTLFFISLRILAEVAFSDWRRHFGFAIICQASSANFPDKLDRWRRIRNRRGQLGKRGRVKILVTASILQLFIFELTPRCFTDVWLHMSADFETAIKRENFASGRIC